MGFFKCETKRRGFGAWLPGAAASPSDDESDDENDRRGAVDANERQGARVAP
jgi:hypothetical protein